MYVYVLKHTKLDDDSELIIDQLVRSLVVELTHPGSSPRHDGCSHFPDGFKW
jgi:hypothetical protein